MTIFEELLQDYARYSYMEGTIDENTMNHLIEDAQNYIVKLNKLKLLGLHNVDQQRELLIAFYSKQNGGMNDTNKHAIIREVDNYIKSINCG